MVDLNTYLIGSDLSFLLSFLLAAELSEGWATALCLEVQMSSKSNAKEDALL